MLHGYPKPVWYTVAGALVLLFIVNYLELPDWRRASIPPLSVVAFVSLWVAFTSAMLIRKRRPASDLYIAGGAAVGSLVLLWLLGVPLTRMLTFAGLAFFAAVVLVVVDWMKGRAAR